MLSVFFCTVLQYPQCKAIICCVCLCVSVCVRMCLYVCVGASAGFSSRPRYVKVFINPSSHKKEAVHIYRDHVAPLFKMADVRTDITGRFLRPFSPLFCCCVSFLLLLAYRQIEGEQNVVLAKMCLTC